MKINSSPSHCTLVFNFTVSGKDFTVSLYQDLKTNDKSVSVLNPDGTIVEDADICQLITKYAIDRYSITYDPGDDTEDQPNLDPAI
jgi:hypothetical protein